MDAAPDSDPAEGTPAEGEPSARRKFEQRIIDEAPRLGPTDVFQFACHPGVSCFGTCCGDVNIALTPYDVLRLKNRLGLTSKEFLDKYAIIPWTKEQQIPIPLLRMRDDERKSCHFVKDGACTVYEDRPWACRMYPIGFAAPQDATGGEPFYFLLEEEGCKGFAEARDQTIADWVADQEIEKYDEMGGLFQPLSFDQRLADGRQLEPKQIQMFWMATYDLDTFRRFVFGSTFLDRFELSEERIEKIKVDDEELMRFAFEWLAFALSGKRTMKLKDDADPEPEA